MMNAPTNPDALFNYDLLAGAYAVQEAASAAVRDHQGRLDAARRDAVAARAIRNGLLTRAATGDVTAAESAAADTALHEAEARVTFLTDADSVLRQRLADAANGIAAAQRNAALPIAVAGARIRLDAARRIAEAKAALAQAERDYDCGTAFLQTATSRGWRPSRDVAVALTPPTRPQTLDETHRMVTLRGTPEAEQALFARAGLLDPAEPAAAA